MGSYIEELKTGREKNSDTVITIDGYAGSGKGTLAKQISGLTGLKHFSASDVFYQVAEERGLEDHELSEKAEKEVDLAVDKKTLERGLNQSCIIESRISSWVLGTHSDLRIRLTAETCERARRLAKREGMRIKEAKKIVEKRDREDARRYKKYYGLELDDYSIYDLIIDNTDMEIEKQKKLVEKALKQALPHEVK